MLKDYCGIIQSVDTESNIITPEIGKLYFINDTGEVKGDLGNGFMKYTKTPIISNTTTIVAGLPDDSLLGNKTPTTKTTYFSYTTLEDAFYQILYLITISSYTTWLNIEIKFGNGFNLIDYVRNECVGNIHNVPIFLKKNTQITGSMNSGGTVNISYSRLYLYKYDIEYI